MDFECPYKEKSTKKDAVAPLQRRNDLQIASANSQTGFYACHNLVMFKLTRLNQAVVV